MRPLPVRPATNAVGGRAAKVRRSTAEEADGGASETVHIFAPDNVGDDAAVDAADGGDQRVRQLLGGTDENEQREGQTSGAQIRGISKGKLRKHEISRLPGKEMPAGRAPKTVASEGDESALIAGIAAGACACVLAAAGLYLVIKRSRGRVKDRPAAKNRQPSALVTACDAPLQPNLPSAVWGPPRTPGEDDRLTRLLGLPREEEDGLARSFREQLSPLPSPLPFAAGRRYSDATSASRVTVPIILDFALQSGSRLPSEPVSPALAPKLRVSTDGGELRSRDAAAAAEDVRPAQSPDFRLFAAPPAPLQILPVAGQPGLSPLQKTARPDSVSSVSSWLEDVSWQAFATGLADPQIAKSPPPPTASIRNHSDAAEDLAA